MDNQGKFDELSDDARPWLFAVARRTMANQSRGWLRRQALDVRLVSLEAREQSDDSVSVAARIDLERAWHALRPTKEQQSWSRA
ncbi:hypothetical protein AB0C04_27825 [Micromonospora sp. NPDC048909]|uniref:hypothetical protein n=1 Tax=Micromonospora sp. NPDC048909 TaxID=3155643 RepID=UPI0033FE9131